MEAVKLEDLDPEAVRAGLSEYQAKLGSLQACACLTTLTTLHASRVQQLGSASTCHGPFLSHALPHSFTSCYSPNLGISPCRAKPMTMRLQQLR